MNDGADTHRSWRRDPRPVRLRPGNHIFHAPDGHWYLFCRGEEFVRLRVQPEQLAALADILSGTRPVEDALAEIADPVAVSALLTKLDRADLLVSTEPVQCSLGDQRVAVHGATPVAAQVVELLAFAGVGRIDQVNDPFTSAFLDLLVTCPGWLPDASWRALDQWCAQHRIPWHMAYVEGQQLYVGPLAVAGSTAGYADVRARRLAAADCPEHLEAYWAYLDAGRGVPPVVWPDVGAVAIAAGLLAADALAILQDLPVPGAGHQLAVDLVTLSIKRHPVLPLPREVILGRR